MKKFLILFLAAAVSFGVSAQQQDKGSELVNVTKAGLKENMDVSFRTTPSVLQVDQYLIPVSTDTEVKLKNEGGAYTVWFALQKGTTVTSTNDASWRRASFSLAFKSKQAAKDFIKAFELAAGKE